MQIKKKDDGLEAFVSYISSWMLLFSTIDTLLDGNNLVDCIAVCLRNHSNNNEFVDLIVIYYSQNNEQNKLNNWRNQKANWNWKKLIAKKRKERKKKYVWILNNNTGTDTDTFCILIKS